MWKDAKYQLEKRQQTNITTKKSQVKLIEPGTKVWVTIKGEQLKGTLIHDSGFQTVCEIDGRKGRYKVINVHKHDISIRLEK